MRVFWIRLLSDGSREFQDIRELVLSFRKLWVSVKKGLSYSHLLWLTDVPLGIQQTVVFGHI